jgi:hypothetical protein
MKEKQHTRSRKAKIFSLGCNSSWDKEAHSNHFYESRTLVVEGISMG